MSASSMLLLQALGRALRLRSPSPSRSLGPRIAGALPSRASDRQKQPAADRAIEPLPPITSTGSSHRGVVWDPASRQWQVQVWSALRNRFVSLGSFAEEAEAARVHDQVAVHLHGR